MSKSLINAPSRLSMEWRLPKKMEYIILFFLLSVYFILAAKDINIPGINFDEAFSATGTINLLKKKDASYVMDFIFFGRRFPLMILPYHGSLMSYILIPFFLILGINVFSLRMASISFGLLTLVFTYLFVKEFFNRRAALITILLLVTSPYFIFATKIGNFTHSYIMFFSVVSLYCLLKWYKGENITFFLLGTFLLGLGLSLSGFFIVFVISLLILALIFRKEIRARIHKDRFKSGRLYSILGAISLCIGDFLFLYANFINKSSKFTTFQCILKRFPNTGLGVDNLDYAKNFLLRFKNLLALLQERDLINNTVSFYKKGNNFYPFLFFALLLWLVFSLFFRKSMHFKKKRSAFLLVLIGIMFLVSPFTLSGFNSFHLFILSPFIQLIVSVGIIEVSQLFKNNILRKISQGFVFISLLTLIFFNFNILRDYYVDMQKIGGQGVWSDAIYELTDWLEEIKPSNIVALNWGFSRNLYFLMGGEKNIDDLHLQHTDNEDEYIKNTTRFFQDKNNRYLVYIHQLPNNREQALFKKAVELSGKNLIEEKIFYQRNGTPIFIVYSVR